MAGLVLMNLWLASPRIPHGPRSIPLRSTEPPLRAVSSPKGATIA